MSATRTSWVAVESVTPRIDSERRCRCGAAIVWDEVYGWLHVAVAVAAARAGWCGAPHPAAHPEDLLTASSPETAIA